MNEKIKALIENIEKIIIGKRGVVELVICSLLAGGHVLIEDVPGVGKTLLAETLAKSVAASFGRIQFTPDLMPSDVVGYTKIDINSGESEYRAGAAMCNFLLADEINRTSPKVQSALLEAMEELQISVDGITHELPEPFMTLATQNPIETYGTYHLPEAQLDRFLMRISIGYPSKEAELLMLDRMPQSLEVNAVLSLEEVLALRDMATRISVAPNVAEYILDITAATRNMPSIVSLGASPRASIALYKASQAMALMNNRSYVTPDDVRRVAAPVLAHRLVLTAGQSQYSSADAVMAKILLDTVVPM